MLINFSNHPTTNWSPKQLEAAKQYGNLIDLPFPAIDPNSEPYEIDFQAETFQVKLLQLLAGENQGLQAVHIMGELTFCFALVNRLQRVGITCLASTTVRETVNNADGSKTVRFGFVRFREYGTYNFE